MKCYGLIGKSLSHSFSKAYFERKFKDESIENCRYENFELNTVEEVLFLIANNLDLRGLNVTIPFKESIIPLLDSISEEARIIGAVNTVKITPENKKIGYNTDYEGFKNSLTKFITSKNQAPDEISLALVLGTGGASKAVQAALIDLNIDFHTVSQSEKGTFSYEQITAETINSHPLIINTTPIGMYPNENRSPDIPYHYLTSKHFLYDLVYNPEETLFLRKGYLQNAAVKGGLDMLYLQAEKAWEIWQSDD